MARQKAGIALGVGDEAHDTCQKSKSAHSSQLHDTAVPSAHNTLHPCRTECVLAIYIPRRNLVELWQPVRGWRLGAFTGLGSHCHLVNAVLPSADHNGLNNLDSIIKKGTATVASMGVLPLTQHGIRQQEVRADCLFSGRVTCLVVDASVGAVTDIGEMLREHTQH
jgi:hypothetical protein